MRAERALVLALMVAAAGVASACGGRDERTGGVHVPSNDERAGAGRAGLADAEVLAPLMTPRAPGRIIYDPPPDLSLTSAQLRRPELLRSFRPDLDTAGRSGRASPARDATGGDAAMLRSRRTTRDTAGAARP